MRHCLPSYVACRIPLFRVRVESLPSPVILIVIAVCLLTSSLQRLAKQLEDLNVPFVDDFTEALTKSDHVVDAVFGSRLPLTCAGGPP